MKQKDAGSNHKVVHLDRVRKGKEIKSSTIELLHDTRQAARAIESKTCLLCQEQKLCVNKTGLCASCFSSLAPREKRIAESEARHKIIEVKVLDDRWNKSDDT